MTDPLLSLRPRLRGFAIDHRDVRPGFVFGAFQGARFDGEQFIPAAVAAGAIAVVARPEAEVAGALHVADAAPRRAFARLAAPFYAPYPGTVVAVTGTNGKTSVAEFVRQLWMRTGHEAASIGTLGVLRGSGDGARPGLTTPDIVTFLKTASALRQEGVTHLAYEASSHGLAQHRAEGVPLQAAAFTNLSRDHLDYHGTMEAYFAAKLRLFSEVLPESGTAVVWLDRRAAGAPWALQLILAARARGLRLLTVGPDGDDLRLLAQTPLAAGQQLAVQAFGRRADLLLPLVGGYQAANALVAAALAVASGSDGARILAALPLLAGVRGRLQLATHTASGAPVYVDYAHTPDGLGAAIAALRPHVAGRLLLVFGCGGDRDRGKRPLMGAIASERADLVFITDDNPRSEDPAAIRAAILAAAPGALEIGDRHQAIAAALAAAGAGDVVLLAGKGHERGQIVGSHVLPFDDVEVARACAGAGQ